MQAGRMINRITYTPPAGELDANGQRTPGVGVELWADVDAIKVVDRAAFGATLATASIKATIRYRDIDAAGYVTWRGHVYMIVGVDSDARQTSCTLYLKAR